MKAIIAADTQITEVVDANIIEHLRKHGRMQRE